MWTKSSLNEKRTYLVGEIIVWVNYSATPECAKLWLSRRKPGFGHWQQLRGGLKLSPMQFPFGELWCITNESVLGEQRWSQVQLVLVCLGSNVLSISWNILSMSTRKFLICLLGTFLVCPGTCMSWKLLIISWTILSVSWNILSISWNILSMSLSAWVRFLSDISQSPSDCVGDVPLLDVTK